MNYIKIAKISDNYSRHIQQRKGNSGAGCSQKTPYIYLQRLQFLIDIIVLKQTINSLESIANLNDESSHKSEKNILRQFIQKKVVLQLRKKDYTLWKQKY